MRHLVNLFTIQALLTVAVLADAGSHHLATDAADIAATSFATSIVSSADDLTKRTPADWRLTCDGTDIGYGTHTCSKTLINGQWCQDNCKCTAGGGLNCAKAKGCDHDLIYGICEMASKGWKCCCR